ncbi:MAG: phosphoribosylanthranilate isomerase [Liquorilactobacillus sp.]|uniref:phosphoribosylanthranilate isomerase n=1 Tax=Liquorilactobacillus sp. TaxID=2767923 RepID=UPI0039ED1EA9
MTGIKICGIKDLKTVAILNQILPDYVGFVFAKSSREVSIEQAKRIREQLLPCIKTIGVFTAFDEQTVEKLVKQKVIQGVQLHTEITNAEVNNLKNKGMLIFQIVNSLTKSLEKVDYLMFDSRIPGSGQLADWNQIDAKGHPFMIAGGLNANNVGEAISRLHPEIVDVSSGVEINGQKDNNKIAEFIRSVRDADKENE